MSRHVLFSILAVGAACGSAGDDASSAGDTGASESTNGGPGPATEPADGSSAADAASADGSTDATPPADADTTDPSACGGDYFCFAENEADCTADPCCVAAFGRGYQQDKVGWCLYDTPEYTGCSHAINDTCDYTGTIQCEDALGITRLFDVESGCFPSGCIVAQAPETNGIPCPE